MLKIKVYTDGACSVSSGRGGYGAIIDTGTEKIELGGYEEHTTNNRMELTAVITALKCAYENFGPCYVTLYSDSKYVVDSIVKNWIVSWRRNDYKRADGTDILNPDLWETFWEIMNKHRSVDFKWVKGHAGNKFNELCDNIATDCIKRRCEPFTIHVVDF